MDRSGKSRQWGPWIFEVLDPRADFLKGAAGNEYSQFGEDGLIEALFERIGARNKFAFECGAAEGIFCSNTKRLRDRGWDAVLIEIDVHKYAELKENAAEGLRPGQSVSCVNAVVGPVPLDRILEEFHAPLDLDLGILDVDGQETHIWRRLTKHRPRVMLVEYSGALSAPVPPEGHQEKGQAGLKEIVELGREKGYAALCRTNVNVLLAEEKTWVTSLTK